MGEPVLGIKIEDGLGALALLRANSALTGARCAELFKGIRDNLKTETAWVE